MELFLLALRQGSGMVLGPYAMAIPVYRTLTRDTGAPARAVAAALLGEDHNDGAVRALEQGLRDKEALVRAAAAQALGKSKRPEEIAELTPLLEDKQETVRLAAAVAILRLSPPAPPAAH
jgi:HEAT repeat protein